MAAISVTFLVCAPQIRSVVVCSAEVQNYGSVLQKYFKVGSNQLFWIPYNQYLQLGV